MKTFLKRLLAVPVIGAGLVLLVGGFYGNVIIKLPMALERSSDFASGAGVVLGTIIGTGILMAISIAIICAGCGLWKKD